MSYSYLFREFEPFFIHKCYTLFISKSQYSIGKNRFQFTENDIIIYYQP